MDKDHTSWQRAVKKLEQWYVAKTYTVYLFGFEVQMTINKCHIACIFMHRF